MKIRLHVFGVAVILAIGIAIGVTMRNEQLPEIASAAFAGNTKASTGIDSESPVQEPQEISPVKARAPRDLYFPNTEDLRPDEMRVIALETGMPSSRRSQAATCFLVEFVWKRWGTDSHAAL